MTQQLKDVTLCSENLYLWLITPSDDSRVLFPLIDFFFLNKAMNRTIFFIVSPDEITQGN